MVADGDATGASLGYRRRALKTLYRILTDNGAKFQPEGKEDLANFQDTGQLSETLASPIRFITCYPRLVKRQVRAKQSIDFFHRIRMPIWAINHLLTGVS